MSLSSGTAGGNGVDSNAVDTYDSGDEWDIGVGNLIIDLDADLEKDKLEMSGTKEGGTMASPPSAVAALPDNIRFVSPVSGKESKSKSKRSKNTKDNSRTSAGDGAKKETSGRPQPEPTTAPAAPTVASSNTSAPGKSPEKGGKVSRGLASSKRDKEGVNGPPKSKKEKSDGGPVVAIAAEKEVVSQSQTVAMGGNCGGPFENTQSLEVAGADQMGNIALESVGIVPTLTIKTEPEELDSGSECRTLKKEKNEKMDSPLNPPAPPPPPLHLMPAVGGGEIASPCEQIMVRTRSLAVNTADVALETEPEILGPCEPGTSVSLEGIVWQETEDGMLVVNVTWRNKTYVGTLLDCTRHDWAPPRFCESPSSDLEMRHGRGRGKRMRPNSNTPITENSHSSDAKGNNSSKTRATSSSKGRRGNQPTAEQQRTPPNSNAEDVKASPASAGKRKTKPTSDMEPNSSSEDTKGSKRMRTNSSSGGTVVGAGAPCCPMPKTEPLPPLLDRNCPSPVLIDCPHPNCNKKYKHINGLKYHQARAHNDDNVKLEVDGDGEYDSTLHPEAGNCNGASITQRGCISPARSATPKGRGFDGQSLSLSPGRVGSKPSSKKKSGDTDPETGSTVMDASEEGPCLTDDASNDGTDDKRGSKKQCGAAKSEKPVHKNMKPSRAGPQEAAAAQQLYSMQVSSFPTASPGSSSGMPPLIQGIPRSPQMKSSQPPKPPNMVDPSPPTLNNSSGSSKDKRKKEKKKKDGGKEADSPKPPGKGGKPEEGKSPYSESSDPGSRSDGLLNGSPHQSRLASIKAEADKIYSFTDNAPSPSIGVASRVDSTGMSQPLTPLHVVTQNGAADNSSVKTNSPAYSDISDAGEDGEGKSDGVKLKTEEQAIRESAKKALFPNQPTNKESPYYANYETYYSPNYTSSSPGGPNQAAPTADGQAKIKREEDQDQGEGKIKGEPHEDRKAEVGGANQPAAQPSVIQQRSSNMYMQPLYYNQYAAYVPPYAYHPDQAYHNHLLNRQQYEERQRQVAEQHRAAEKKSDAAIKDREASMKEEWKHKAASLPPTLSKAPGQADLGKGPQPSGKPKDSPSEASKSTGGMKGEDAKPQQAEGLKMKLSEGGYHGKEEAKPGMDHRGQLGAEQATWHRQYPDNHKPQQEEDQQPQPRWKDERDRDRERDRKGKEERPRPKDGSIPREEGGKEGADPRMSPRVSSEEHRGVAKDPRGNAHMQFSSMPGQPQGYVPYMHGYPYGQGYEPGHPGYRGMPSVMMHNYPGSYLPAGYPFSPYAGKMATGEEGGDKSRASPTASKATSDSKALEILHQHASHQHASQYKSSKSPTVGDKPSQDRERERAGGAERERERDAERPRSSPSQRVIPSHHHMGGYPLLSGQYDLPYATGLSSAAIVASQQAAAPSLYPPPRR